MMRNLGGSVGIAVLATLLTNREKVPQRAGGESVSLLNPATQERLDTLTQNWPGSRPRPERRAGQCHAARQHRPPCESQGVDGLPTTPSPCSVALLLPSPPSDGQEGAGWYRRCRAMRTEIETP